MRDQLQVLLQLQTSDVKVRELEAAAKQLPAKLDPLRRDLAKLQTMIDGERTKLADAETWRKTQQDQIDRERDALKSAQSKVQASRNSKEWSAASREVGAVTERQCEVERMFAHAITARVRVARYAPAPSP